jgi:hypothetical protein
LTRNVQFFGTESSYTVPNQENAGDGSDYLHCVNFVAMKLFGFKENVKMCYGARESSSFYLPLVLQLGTSSFSL